MLLAQAPAALALSEEAAARISAALAFEALQSALETANSHGNTSLLASIVENTRLTPGRADAIERLASQLRPDLSKSIARAVDTGNRLAELYPGASLRAMPQSRFGFEKKRPNSIGFLFPGGDPSIDKSDLSEFQRNYSLDMMHVEAARDLGYSGSGVVVGIIDSGIDRRPNGTAHPEFEGRVDPRSTSYLHWFDTSLDGDTLTVAEFEAAFQQGASDTFDLDGHGTHVAGIVGAGRNGFGMEGVAPGVTFLSVAAIAGAEGAVTVNGVEMDIDDLQLCGKDFLNGICDPVTGAVVPDTAGFSYLAQFSDVKVINGSFGPYIEDGAQTWDLPEDEQDQLLADATAMRESLDAGQIIVMAAGNEYLQAPIVAENPIGNGLFPFIQPGNQDTTNSSGELIYDDDGTGLDLSTTSADVLSAAEQADGIDRGRVVVVVALDANSQIAPYSNRCGVAKEWCLAAPGGGLTTDSGIYSTFPEDQGSYASENGTSMAAPNVSGAIAVLIEAYPAFTPAEILEALFLTAEDLGAKGVDEVYGWGLPRLDRALTIRSVDITGSGIYVVGADGTDTTWIASFESEGGLDKQGSGTLALQGAATFNGPASVTGGLLSVNSSLTVPTLTVGANGTLGGSGTVTGDVEIFGTLAPGNSPGTLTVTGDVTLSSTANTEIDVDGTGTENGAGNFDRILVTGTGSVFTADGTITPVLRGISGSATNSFTPDVGDVFTFVQVSDGSVAGSFDSLVQPTDGLADGTRFDVLYGTSSLSLATTPTSYADLGAHGITLSGNVVALARALDAGRPAAGVRPGAAYTDAYNVLYAASIADLSSGLQTLTGQIHAEMGTTAVRAVGRFADTLGERQLQQVVGWIAPGSTPYGTGTAWLIGTSGLTNVGSKGGVEGFDAKTNSVAFGIDWNFSDGTAGIAGSYEHADVSAVSTGSGRAETYQGALYTTFETGVVDLSARAGLSYGSLSTRRTTSLGSYQAIATADGHGVGGFVEASAFRAFETQNVTLTPSVSLGYRAFHRDDMNEEGSVFGLSVPSAAFEDLQTTLGLALSTRVSLKNGVQLAPLLSVGWRHDFTDTARSVPVGLLGSDFDVEGAEIGNDAFLGRLSLTAIATERHSFEAAYQAEIRDNLDSHVFSLAARLRF
ncbi:S8 family serine peptidase [Roseibium sediminicola]|uniref:S8 family serine peptidase n=1 Tax=Roseibium sediminicola TaxID=2933272 RepID=A0ABT0GS43_9HYPH|nr:S8 family serine peptidase [Roseibium sp. CAU 1639]MCK7612261.1 S8 family serine peptidase [Roseibium sp. CAU 1639]